MAWLKKVAAGVGAFLTEWAGHPRRIRGTVEYVSNRYGIINCKLGRLPFRLDEIQADRETPKQGDTVEFELKGGKEKGYAAKCVVRVP